MSSLMISDPDSLTTLMYVFSDTMVKLLYFDRVKPDLPDIMDEAVLEPAVNKNYYCPGLFYARSSAEIAPQESVMVMTESTEPVSKYVGFLDMMINQPDKKITSKLTNWHPTEKINIVKGMLLIEVLKNPFVHESFCVLRLTEVAGHGPNKILEETNAPRSEHWPISYTSPQWRGKRKHDDVDDDDDEYDDDDEVTHQLKDCHFSNN